MEKVKWVKKDNGEDSWWETTIPCGINRVIELSVCNTGGFVCAGARICWYEGQQSVDILGFLEDRSVSWMKKELVRRVNEMLLGVMQGLNNL